MHFNFIIQVWTITASDIDWNKGKRCIIELFEQYGKVLEVICVGTTHPLESVEVCMDSFESCEKAIEALNALKAPGKSMAPALRSLTTPSFECDLTGMRNPKSTRWRYLVCQFYFP